MAEIDVVEGSDGQPIIRVNESPRWQAEPPEEDGMYVVMDSDGVLGVADRYLRTEGEFSTLAPSGWKFDEPLSWWFVPALDLPPLPEEEP